MRKDKLIAIQLRKSGKSYSEISRLINASKSTLSYWLKDVALSKSAKEKIENRGRKLSINALVERNKYQTVLAKEKAKMIRNNFAKEIGKISKRELLLVGTALYWGEGYKKGVEGSIWKCVDFTNSDPMMVKVMMRFFREVCEVKNKEFKAQLALYEEKYKEKSKNFWSKITRIPKNQFIKTSFARSILSKGKQKKYLENGTIHIRVYNVNLFHKIIGFIDGLKTGCSSVG